MIDDTAADEGLLHAGDELLEGDEAQPSGPGRPAQGVPSSADEHILEMNGGTEAQAGRQEALQIEQNSTDGKSRSMRKKEMVRLWV